jgi:hypothetical protein
VVRFARLIGAAACLADLVVDQRCRRMQQATLGHRGHKHDSLDRIRKFLLTARSSSRAGRTRLRPVHVAVGTPAARAALGTASTGGCDGVRVAEPTRLARSVRAWEVKLLAFHATNDCYSIAASPGRLTEP